MSDGSQSLSFRRMHVAIIPTFARPGLWIRRAKQSKIPIRISATHRQMHGTPLIESFRRHTRTEQAEFVRTYEFESWQRNMTYLFSITSRPALGPTHPPVQWVPGIVPPPPLGGKAAGAWSWSSHLRQMPRSMSGAIFPLHLYAFMAYVGITLLFTFLSYVGLYLRVKLNLEDATKAQKGNRCITLFFL